MVSGFRLRFCRAVCGRIALSRGDLITSGAVFGVMAAPRGLRWGRAPGIRPPPLAVTHGRDLGFV